MDEKTQKLFYALIDFLDIKDSYVLEDGLSISNTINDVLREPFIRELNIKLRYVDEEKLKAYRMGKELQNKVVSNMKGENKNGSEDCKD